MGLPTQSLSAYVGYCRFKKVEGKTLFSDSGAKKGEATLASWSRNVFMEKAVYKVDSIWQAERNGVVIYSEEVALVEKEKWKLQDAFGAA